MSRNKTVAEVVADVQRVNALLERREQLKRLVSELEEVEREIQERHKAVIVAMRKLDVADSGNFGWENRVMGFLLAFVSPPSESAEVREVPS